MKSFKNLFRSKKDNEKDKENLKSYNIHNIEHARLPPAIKPNLQPHLFADDMSLANPTAAYHSEPKPATRRPLQSCPGDVSSNPRHHHHHRHNNRQFLSDSEDEDDIQYRHERRRSKAPRSHYGGERKTFTSRTKFESKETSEYGSDDRSPISNVLKAAYDTDDYYSKYRKYKNQAIHFYQQSKELKNENEELKKQLKESNQRKNNLIQQVENLRRQLQTAHNYNYNLPQYPSYYSHQHHQQRFAPPPPPSTFPPLPMTFSTAPTIPAVEQDDIKIFRQTENNDSKSLSQSSFSSTFSNFKNFQPDIKHDNRINSQSLFAAVDDHRENTAPPSHSFSNNF